MLGVGVGLDYQKRPWDSLGHIGSLVRDSTPVYVLIRRVTLMKSYMLSHLAVFMLHGIRS